MRFLGNIAPANGASKNNSDTATPFTILAGTAEIVLLTSASGMYFEAGVDDTVTTSATTGFPLTANVAATFRVGGIYRYVAIHNGSGGAASVRVWGAL